MVGPPAADLAGRTAPPRRPCPACAWRVLAGRPRPVAADDLLPERAWPVTATPAGSWSWRSTCRCRSAKGTLIETLDGVLQPRPVDRGAARALFVHPNTVRYRLRQAAELTGLSADRARDALTLQIALVLGRLSRAGVTGQSQSL